MKNFIEVKNDNGKIIKLVGDKDGTYISTLEMGYIILPTGEFVLLENDHGQSMEIFFNQFYNVSNDFGQRRTTFEMIRMLSLRGFVIYIGTKRGVTKLKEYDDFGFGLIYLPKEDCITNEQKISLKKLIDSNNFITNPNKEKIRLSYSNGTDFSIRYTSEEINELVKVPNDFVK